MLMTDPVVLMQSDFSDGTFRIKESGYYQLGENIVFEPNPIYPSVDNVK